MEENNLILGKITNGRGGIGRTYSESMIITLSSIDIYKLTRKTDREKLYITSSGKIFISDKDTDMCKELEILNMIYNCENEYFVEVIKKDALYRHLRDERMQVELLRRVIEEGSYGRK